MTTTDVVDRPSEAVAVAERYRRRERPLSALIVCLVVSAFLGTYVVTSLVPATVVGAALAVVARAPVLRSRGTVRLRTDDPPDAVVDAFAGPTPPVLAFQWGIADEVRPGTDSVTYETTYLFGRRSVEVTVESHTERTSTDARCVELVVTAANRPWATYTATVRERDGGTVVDVEYASTRRFGLRRLPQQWVAERYRERALAVQGYVVVDRDAHVGR
ncbi:hypothetical protein [Halorubellus salinus]|uniref:hypothetical protein n=1 Tax=Halorubellus salinus TaxID=755309 RepID=UPI001D0752C7|nr:hypothetical protein [Halorubellus salinus]